MMETGLFDPLFRVPFVTGALIAVALPLLGALLRLREEWLATLGLAYLGGVGALLALAAGAPAVLGAALAAPAAAGAKAAVAGRGNDAYGVMLIIGWASLLLLGANTGAGTAGALIDGQVYFAGPLELAAAALLVAVTLAALPWLAQRLLRARLCPHHDGANRLPAWRWRLGFDLLAAVGIAVATATLGILGSLALSFLPAWVAFRRAPSWRSALVLSALIGLAAYSGAFALALWLDQPFAPLLALVLLAAAAAAALPRLGKD